GLTARLFSSNAAAKLSIPISIFESIRAESSAERKGERLDAGGKELDLEPPIDDRHRLADQLIQPRLDHRAVAALVHVEAVSRARRPAVNRDAETNRAALARRPHHQMQIPGVKAVDDSRAGTARDSRLPAHRPLAGERPFVEREAGGRAVGMTTIRFGAA